MLLQSTDGNREESTVESFPRIQADKHLDDH